MERTRDLYQELGYSRRLAACKDTLSELKSSINPAHKSGDAWVRIASSVQSRGGRPLILECAPCQDCTLEAMRAQVFANAENYQSSAMKYWMKLSAICMLELSPELLMKPAALFLKDY